MKIEQRKFLYSKRTEELLNINTGCLLLYNYYFINICHLFSVYCPNAHAKT